MMENERVRPWQWADRGNCAPTSNYQGEADGRRGRVKAVTSDDLQRSYCVRTKT